MVKTWGGLWEVPGSKFQKEKVNFLKQLRSLDALKHALFTMHIWKLNM